MHIVVVGLNHKTAPIEIREKLSFSEKRLQEPLKRLSVYSEIKGKVILSTCNRVEIYATTQDFSRGVTEIKEFLSEYHGVPLADFEKYLYCYSTRETIKHIFRVSSSLDSMVIGEPQILGQVKAAYFSAKESNFAGPVLNRLFQKSFAVAKRIRNNTLIATSAVSVSSVAVELAKKILGGLKGKTVMLIGAGKMAELAANHLVSNGVKTLLITNRTFEHAVELAHKLNGTAIPFKNFTDQFLSTDIAISSTEAPYFIVKKEGIIDIIHARQNKPMIFIDIALPRDIEPSVNEIGNVHLYNIDDLGNVIKSNIKGREKEGQKAEKIISEEVLQFSHWLEIMPAISSLRKRAEKVRKQKMQKALCHLSNISAKEKDTIDMLTSAIVNKILHVPITNIKKETKSSNAHEHLKAFRRLFSLDE